MLPCFPMAQGFGEYIHHDLGGAICDVDDTISDGFTDKAYVDVLCPSVELPILGQGYG